tara:strand:- start:3722 stop:3898 length:177 start_codon:yes stop_codon:yes gene_type:complete
MGIFTRYTEEEKEAIAKARKVKSLELRQQEIRGLVESLRKEQRQVVSELESVQINEGK